MAAIRILVVDDQQFMRAALATTLTARREAVEIVGVAVNGEDAVLRAAELGPEVVVMDIRMPGMNGLEAAHRITARRPGTGVVIVSSHDDTAYILELFKYGMEGKAYLLKQSIDEVQELVHAITAVAAGRTVLDPTIAEKLAQEYSRRMAPEPQPTASAKPTPPDVLGSLTHREQWVLALLAEGYTTDAILRTVHCDLATLDEIRGSLADRLGVSADGMDGLNYEAVLALIDPHDELRRSWVAGYKGRAPVPSAG